jgi:flagellar biosynthesis protein FlhA
MDGFLDRLKNLTKNSDLAVAIGLLVVMLVMIVPIPSWLLDGFLALSLALSVIILLMSVYAKKPLDFSTFPSVLLITTLLRLSLNVASTRNILLDGPSEGTAAAGAVIESFGEFVVGGNYAVGIILFIIFFYIFNFRFSILLFIFSFYIFDFRFLVIIKTIKRKYFIVLKYIIF